jgi:hypothetical protein
MRSMVDLPEPEGPSRATISGDDGEIGRGDYLNAILAGLRVVLLDLLGANDRLDGRDRLWGRGRGLAFAGDACFFHDWFSGWGSQARSRGQ